MSVHGCQPIESSPFTRTTALTCVTRVLPAAEPASGASARLQRGRGRGTRTTQLRRHAASLLIGVGLFWRQLVSNCVLLVRWAGKEGNYSYKPALLTLFLWFPTNRQVVLESKGRCVPCRVCKVFRSQPGFPRMMARGHKGSTLV